MGNVRGGGDGVIWGCEGWRVMCDMGMCGVEVMM